MRGHYGETYLFRPLEGSGRWLRYAGGLWLPDDGEFDLAFVNADQPIALGVSLPGYEGIEWSWRDLAATRAVIGVVSEYAAVDAWHTQVRDPAEGKGNHVPFYGHIEQSHPNVYAFRAAMDKCCELYHCAGGRGPHFDLGDPWIAAGLVRTFAGEVVREPEAPACFLCANEGLGHKLRYLKAERERLESALAYATEQVDKLEIDLYHQKDEVTRLTERLAAFDSVLQREVVSAP
jgi:hypothetical protein